MSLQASSNNWAQCHNCHNWRPFSKNEKLPHHPTCKDSSFYSKPSRSVINTYHCDMPPLVSETALNYFLNISCKTPKFEEWIECTDCRKWRWLESKAKTSASAPTDPSLDRFTCSYIKLPCNAPAVASEEEINDLLGIEEQSSPEPMERDVIPRAVFREALGLRGRSNSSSQQPHVLPAIATPTAKKIKRKTPLPFKKEILRRFLLQQQNNA